MEKTLRNTAIKLSKEAAFVFLTVVSAVLLPQIFHAAGVLFGVGGALGQIFLPMYIPVLIIGFYRGFAAGAIAGLASPLVSFWLTGMPAAALLPYITVELVATGLFAGIFSKVKLPAPLSVFSVQLIAKAHRILALAVNLYFANGIVSASALFAGILISLPGVIIQVVLLSILIIKKGKKENV